MASIFFDTKKSLLKCGKNKYGGPKDINKYKPSSKLNGLKRGDLIIFTKYGKDCERYRNEGVYIWNGTNIEYLDSEIDDYGSIPPTFKIGEEFPADYWTRIYEGKKYFMIAHNEILHMDEELYEKIIIEYNKEAKEYNYTKKYSYTGNVEIHGKNVLILFNDYDDKITDEDFLKDYLKKHPTMNFIDGLKEDEIIKLECIIE